MRVTVQASIRRLSDEEPDPIENEDSALEPSGGGWAPWSPETIQDVHNIIAEKLNDKQREIIQAHLMGYNHRDLLVTEKYWRYWYASAVNKIKKELNL